MEGDTINIEFLNKHYKVDILQAKPENQYHAVCVVDADVEVDFAPPLDFEENQKLPNLLKKNSSVVYEEEKKKEEEQKLKPFSGTATRIDGKPIDPNKKKPSEDLSSQ